MQPLTRKALTVLCLMGASRLLAPEALPQSAVAPRAGDGEQITLAQYREMCLKNRPAAPAGKKTPLPPPPDFRASDEAFRQVLLAQARAAAARQSQDRLAGWNKAIQPRVQVQSIAALDVEILLQAEQRIASDVARLEASLRRAVARANELARRPPEASLLAVIDSLPPGSPDAAALEKIQKEVLPRGQELLAKMFQSYSVGGSDLYELLWQEQQATRTETDYRVWAVTAGFEVAVTSSGEIK